MRSRLAIIIPIALVVVLLVVLNAASYVSVERTRDSEFSPDRSTYNSGPTGTRALYDFLNETKRQVTRWREAPAALLNTTSARTTQPTTFVVIGETRQEFDSAEAADLLRWVERGGRLVLIDRSPDARLLPSSDDWLVSMQFGQFPAVDAVSGNADELTAGVPLAHPVQPTALTQGIENTQPSRYASTIKIASTTAPEAETKPKSISTAPVAHLTDNRGALVVDYPHGRGRIVILSDPFMVANKGINQADNLRLAVNLLASSGGLIAFDEYHQGRRATQNEVAAYFSGTPVLAMLAQLGVIVLAVLWTNGRRFARPLPVPQVDRRSSLEFVASMAELQQRARAYDLAIENIYARLRRVLARYAGVDGGSPRALIAERIAARSGKIDRQQLEALMFECEETINGAPIDAKKSLALIARLREVERTLGLRMRTRDIRQAKEQKG